MAATEADSYALAVATRIGSSHRATDPYMLYLVANHEHVATRLRAAPASLFRDYVLALVQEAVASHRAAAVTAMKTVIAAAADAREASAPQPTNH